MVISTPPSWLPWDVKDVSGWRVGPPETRGARAKHWIVDADGTFWLRKSPRDRSPFEPAIECLALRLARASGIEAAEAWPCVWRTSGEPRRGIIVRRFLTGSEELQSGDRILRGQDPDYDRSAYPAHTVERALAALASIERSAGDLSRPFLRMLAFDLIIGNGDRHQGNWSVIDSPAGRRLAPMYDPAGCLGAELQPGHRMLRQPTSEDIQKYAAGCPSGFGDESRMLKLAEVEQALIGVDEWAAIASVVRAHVRLALEGMTAYVEQVPLDWYPGELRRLGRLVLEHRLGSQ